MVDRKRKEHPGKVDQKNAGKTGQVHVRRNPFCDNVVDERGEDETLDNVLAFVELTDEAKQLGKDGQNLVSSSVASKLESIASFLLTEVTETSSSSLSKQDVSFLLIPWAAKILVFLSAGQSKAQPLASSHAKTSSREGTNQYDLAVAWRMMALSLRIVLEAEVVDFVAVNNILNQSILNKLLRFALRCSIKNQPLIMEHAAQSFALLAGHLYRPTFDLYCNTIIVDLGGYVESAVSGGALQAVTLSAILLLRALQKKEVSSPKKMFQVLASKPVLLSISKVLFNELNGQSTVSIALREVLWEGFFSPAKHIEGYWSMKIGLPSNEPYSEEVTKASSFHCYQWDLVNSLNSLLESQKTSESEVAMSQIIALLAEGFLVQTFVWQRDYRTRSKAKADGSLSSLQFRFWGSLTGALLTKLESRTGGIDDLIPSLLSCLRALLKHDGYHPTFEDKDQLYFLFLKSVSTRTCALFEQHNANEALAAMECLIRLNHLVVHDDLTEIIALATVPVPCRDTQKKAVLRTKLSLSEERLCQLTTPPQHFHALLGTLFQTYHHLRQLDYLVQCLVSSLPSAHSSDHDDRANTSVAVLKGALEDPEVLKTVVAAVEAAPHGQTQLLFQILNEWLVKETSAKDDVQPTSDTALVQTVSVVVSLFVLLLRNIRVNEHTSKDILSLCEKSLEQSGSMLLERAQESRNKLAMSKDGIKLCGWIVDLQNRCSFWSSGPDALEVVSLDRAETLRSVLADLSEDLEQPKSAVHLFADTYRTARYELQFLACYRIQQLHSIIHQKQRDVFSLDSNALSQESALRAEATRLTAFLIASAKNTTRLPSEDERADENPWILLAKFYPAWTPYGSNEHIFYFLEWLFTANAGLEAKQAFAKDTTSSTVLRREKGAEAKKVVTALMHDSAFFENQKMMDYFAPFGILFARMLLQMEHRSVAAIISEIEIGEAAQLDSLFESRRIREDFVSGTDRISRPELSTDVQHAYLRGAAETLASLNGAPRGSRTCQMISYIITCLLDVDISIRSFLIGKLDKSDSVSVGLEIMANARNLLCDVLLENDRSIVRDLFNSPADWSSKLILGIISSTNDVVLQCSPDLQSRAILANASGRLVSAVGFISIDIGKVKSLKQILGESIESSQVRANSVGRVLVRACAVGVQLAMSDTPTVADKFAEHLLEKVMARAPPVCEDEYPSFLLMVGDLTSLSGLDSSSSCTDILVEHISSTRPKDLMEELGYLSGVTINNQRMPEDVPGILRDHILSCDRFGAMEVPMICSMLSKISPSDFNAFLERMLSYFHQSSKASNILCRLVANTERQDHRRIVGDFGLRILQESADSLRSFNDAAQVQSAGLLLIELIKHKDLVKMKERDIARLLAQLCCLMQDADETGANEATVEFFALSCSIVTSLIQRFPRQLYTGVASLILVLQKLFRFVLHHKQPVMETEQQARELTRVFGMLPAHKEILKKHILGLIIDFVDALSHDLMPSTKNAVAPSVYFLLEIMSEYEINQLNALLGTSGKVLFKTFYEGFQKRHVYRGRF